MGEKVHSNPNSTQSQTSNEGAISFPDFNPENAKTLQAETKNIEETPETRFNVDPKEFPIFVKQGEYRKDEATGIWKGETLNINETLGRMVAETAKTIAFMTGKSDALSGWTFQKGERKASSYEALPAADHVIYLDKSARPVQWLVDEFWDEFAEPDEKQPPHSFLAIDRRVWYKDYLGLDIDDKDYVVGSDGKKRLATFEEDFLPIAKQKMPKEFLARIRALYIEGGIKNEDPDEIMKTPTKLDGKNILIIDEVSRSGSTLQIAAWLLANAIPEAKSVNGRIFWEPGTLDLDEKTGGGGERQMLSAPAWYPADPRDWRGRGVKDIDPSHYEKIYEEMPNDINRANKYGSFVLGVPIEDEEEDPLSFELHREIKKMHQEYQMGHILPNLGKLPFDMMDKVQERLEKWGVNFPPHAPKWSNEPTPKPTPRDYDELLKKRDMLPRKTPR